VRPGARALIAAVALAGASACDGTLWVVNGLEVPVKVTVAGQAPFQLEPGARKSLQVPGGPRAVGAETLDGKRRETDQVEVPRSGAAVYSVAGAAPLYVLTAFYSSHRGNERPPNHEILCGVRTFQRDVSYYFAEPPDSVTTSNSQTSVVRSALLLGRASWKDCLYMLQAEGKERAALEMLPAVREMDPSVGLFSAEARLHWVLGEDAKALAAYRNGIAAYPSRDAHHAYLRFGLIAGKREELLRQYQRPVDGLPDAERRALAALLLPAAEAVKEYRALAGALPQDDEMRLGLAWALNGAGRHAEALSAIEPLGDGSRLAEDDRPRLLRRRVWSLAALGRHEEAVQALRAAFDGKEPLDDRFFIIQGLLAAKLSRPELEPEAKSYGTDTLADREWRQLTYDGVVHPERLDRERIDGLRYVRSLAPVLARAAAEPRLALALIHRYSNYEAAAIPEAVAVVLWAEACRTGDSAEPLLRHALLGMALDFGALCAYVKEGRPAMEMTEAWEERAAIHLARSRALRARGDAAGAAAEEALVRKHDIYRGPATRALESWPSTAPGARPPAAGDTRLASAQATTAPPRAPRGAQPVAVPPKPVEHKLIRVEGLRLEPAP
jgi:tetratricopeptide (TPR) repeat protein